MSTAAGLLTPPPPPPQRLPPPLVLAVLAFAADRATRLHTLARLSREHLALARGTARAAAEHVITVSTAAIASPQGLEPLYQRLASQRSVPIYELRVRVSVDDHIPWWIDAQGDSNDANADEVEEEAANLVATACELLGHLPELRTLVVLRRVNGASACPAPLVAVLRAAAWLCPKIKTLRLPASEPSPFNSSEPLEQHGESVSAVLAALVEALPAWRRHGGLTRVVASTPFSWMRDRDVQASRWLTALATNCPNLERLSSPNKRRRELREDGLVQEEHWHVGLDAWAAFCAGCTQLTRFDWTNAPFATAFFEVFGRVVKPRLETLVLVAAPDWAWHVYHRRHARLVDGFGDTARDPQRALPACPALRHLIVGDDDRVSESIFGDAFCETLALHCRNLERFVVVMPARRAHEQAATARTFTDRAVRALVSLPQLTTVGLRTVNITGDGLFALAADFARSDWKRQRTYTLRVGDMADPRYTTTFYDVVMQFLTRLAQWEDGALPCADERVALRVYNGNAEARWPTAQQAAFRQLVDTVLRKHPTVGLRVAVTQPLFSTNYHHPISFHAITDLVFYTARAAPRLGASFAAFGDPSYVNVFVDPKTMRADWPKDALDWRRGLEEDNRDLGDDDDHPPLRRRRLLLRLRLR